MARNQHLVAGSIAAIVAILALVFGTNALLIVGAFVTVTSAVLAVERVRRLRIAKRRDEANKAPLAANPLVFRSFSVFVNNAKIGLATEAHLKLCRARGTRPRTASLRLVMYVPTAAPAERFEELGAFRRAYLQQTSLDRVSCAPIAGDVMYLRQARVVDIEILSDHTKGTTVAIVQLEAPISPGGLTLIPGDPGVAA
ncbi:MAG TPA: hypothetical protein VG734_25900 [Lacunisphaera sp.]|nr:hypothetical protein [Lacunisphaera sp.]